MTDTPRPQDGDAPAPTSGPDDTWSDAPSPWPGQSPVPTAGSVRAAGAPDDPPSFASVGQEGPGRLDQPGAGSPVMEDGADPAHALASPAAALASPALPDGARGPTESRRVADDGSFAVPASVGGDPETSVAALDGVGGVAAAVTSPSAPAWAPGSTDSEDPGGQEPTVETPTPDAATDPGSPAAAVDPFAACRYLAAASGGWRASDAIRDHRCTALDPPSPIALDKQRRLCLSSAHASCPTFLAARAERRRALGSVDPAWEPDRPVVRTAPVVVGAPKRDRALAGLATPARLGEAALGIMAVVVVVLLGSRVLGGAGAPEPSPIAVVDATVTPVATAGASSAAGSPGAGASGSPSGNTGDASATPAPSAAASPVPSTKPSASPRRTYTVKSGDTLTAIAAKYGTTVTAIMKLNKIKDARSIRSGQILKIP